MTVLLKKYVFWGIIPTSLCKLEYVGQDVYVYTVNEGAGWNEMSLNLQTTLDGGDVLAID